MRATVVAVHARMVRILGMEIGMKLPKWNRATLASDYIFSLACFVVGYVVVTAVSLGRIKYDDREGPGLNPVTRMPDGKVGLSETAIGAIGFVAMGVGLAALLGLVWIWLHVRPR